MATKASLRTTADFETFRLRRFVERLIDMGEVDIHDESVPMAQISSIVEATDKAVLFRKAGPEGIELAVAVCGGRKRIAAAFDTTPDKVADEYLRRIANPQPVFEVRQDEAPVQEVAVTGKDVDLTRLPFHPHHEHDGSVYLNCGIDFTVDPDTGLTNVGARRLSLRNRTECGTNITDPSDLKRICKKVFARGQRLPISFTIGAHPLDQMGAGMKRPGDEVKEVATLRGQPVPLVKCLTNDISVPADAEAVLEGYLSERGYVEPEGPYGEYMGYYGPMHLDPVFHCTAITMRGDVLHQSLLHGSGRILDRCDSINMNALRTEAEVMALLRQTIREPVAVRMMTNGGSANNVRVAIRQHTIGEARNAIAAIFGRVMRIKHVFVFDDDIDIFDDRQCEWALGTRFQAHRDLVILEGLRGMAMDPSLQGAPTGAKAGFDCTRPLGRDHRVTSWRPAAKRFAGKARHQTVEQALEAGPLFFSAAMEAVGSLDGREVACALDELRRRGKLGRDRDGRYHLGAFVPGATGIVGELDHDPNDVG
jgi:UbiD family decarboxylase